MNLTLAILSWRQPKTLRNTLESYRKNGLLDLAAQKLIFFNEISKEDRKIAAEYGFEVLGASQNIGIGLPFQKLVEAATGKYFLFCENDFMLVEKEEITRSRMTEAMRLIDEGLTAVRLRHRKYSGDPNGYLQRIWSGQLDPMLPCIDGVYYWEDPQKVYGDRVEKQHRGDEDIYIMDSGDCGYSNNPTLYQTEFLKKNILPLKFSTIDVIENKVGDWWYKAHLRVGHGTGLFKHHPLELSGSGFANFKRVKSPVKKWWHYLLRVGVRRNVINLFFLQFLPTICKININLGNKVMINLSLGRYESV